MKKRILSMALALALALSLCVPALAAEEEPAAEPFGDAAPTQRIKEVHMTWFDSAGSTNDVIFGYSYDNGGVLPSSISNGSTTDTFSYDDAGRIILTDDGAPGTATYTYDEDGHLIEKKDGSYVYTYWYDEDGRLQRYTFDYGDDMADEYEYNYIGLTIANVTHKYGNDMNDFYVCFDDDGRLTEYGEESMVYTYAPQLRIGYCSPSLAEFIIEEDGGFDINRNYYATYLQLDVLDAAGTPINILDSYGGWFSPIELTYDDAGYLTHMESANGCVADFTYEPVA